MTILEQAKIYEKELIGIRNHLHEYPELSEKEYQTLEFVKNKLKEYRIDYVEIENGGILGFLENGCNEKTVLLRADMDALPILENKKNLKRDKKNVSKNVGVAHACGHDAHTAMLLISAKVLKQNIDKMNGKVILCFERAEEVGGGISYLLDYFDRSELRIDGCFGLHVNPQLDAGLLSVNAGPVMAGACGFEVKIIGKDGHGSRPDIANNPLDCFVAIYNALNMIRLKYISPLDKLTISVAKIAGGTRGNIIEKEFIFGGSARFFKEEVGLKFREEFLNILENMTKAYHCNYSNASLFIGTPVINDPHLSNLARESIMENLGEEYVTGSEPYMGSESMSRYLKKYSGVFGFLGVKNEEYGSGADLHNEYFDIDETALKNGVAATVAFAFKFLNEVGG